MCDVVNLLLIKNKIRRNTDVTDRNLFYFAKFINFTSANILQACQIFDMLNVS